MKKIKDLGFFIKVFLFFFIVYSLFSHWLGWNEGTRYYLSQAISKESRFEIDTYSNFTGDRSFYNNHYYSDKAPGVSFIQSAIHLFHNKEEAPDILVPYEFHKIAIYDAFELNSIELFFRLLFVVLNSGIFGALTMVLVAKVAEIEKTEKAMIFVLVFGLATMIFTYSAVLPGLIAATFFSFLSFYILAYRESPFLSGIFAGISPLFDYMSVFIIPSNLLLLNKKKIMPFALGVFLGLLPTFLYNFVIFSNPFVFPLMHVDKELWLGSKIDYRNWITSLSEILFLPYRGLFFYYPLMIFSIIGIAKMIKNNDNKKQALSISTYFSCIVIVATVFLYTTAGSSFSIRYLVYITPFMLIPILKLLKNRPIKSIIFSSFLILALISLVFNLSAFSIPWEGPKYVIEGNELLDVPSYSNPLVEYYLPALLEYGPRSRILEHLLIGEIPDIRDFSSHTREIRLFTIKPFGILMLKTSYLVIPILLAIISLIWRNEIFGKKKTN